MLFLLILNIIYIVGSDLVNVINDNHIGWEAKSTLLDTEEFREDILPEITPERFTLAPVKGVNAKNKTLPETYDWRNERKGCNGTRVDGGPCANSWAIAPALVMTYRSCNSGKNITYSSVRVLSCCTGCGAGCYGGYPWRAFNYMKSEGVPSEICQPLVIRSELPIRAIPPFCRIKNCDNNIAYKQNKIKSFYQVENIKNEIYERGPVVSYMNLYKDFFYYKKGIYKHKFGQKVGKLSVILLGWGTDNGTDYWIGENTWGSQWGENGYFRVIRGKNHVNIEQYVIAGLL